MLSFDLLYPDEQKRREGRGSSRISAALLHDLQLDELAERGILGGEEYQILCGEIEQLPGDVEVIRFRQTVMQDLMENPAFVKGLSALCRQLKDDIPRKRYDIWEPQTPVYKNLVDYVELLKRNCQVLYGTDFSAETKFHSEVLNNLVIFLREGGCRRKLEEAVGLLEEILEAGAVGYQVQYTWGQAMSRVVIQELSRDSVCPMKEKRLLKRKTPDKDRIVSADGNPVLRNNIAEIYSKTIVRLCDFASRLNHAVVGAFQRIQSGLSYYRAGITLYRMYRDLDIPVCLPLVWKGEQGRMTFAGLFPLRLAAECFQQGGAGSSAKIQCNDYSNMEGRIAFITGYNSGGKTVFLQSLGTAQIMYQLGFYVPARSFQAAPVSYIGSLFGSMEDQKTEHGKLQQELVQVRELARQLKRGSLILLNEILATTSEKEGSEIMGEVLHAFSKMQAHMVFVTHLFRLADAAQKGRLCLADGERGLNYVTEKYDEKEGDEKTYRIIQGAPMDDIYEGRFADQYLKIK